MKLVTTPQLKLTGEEFDTLYAAAYILDKICNELKNNLLPLVDGKSTTSVEISDLGSLLKDIADSSLEQKEYE